MELDDEDVAEHVSTMIEQSDAATNEDGGPADGASVGKRASLKRRVTAVANGIAKTAQGEVPLAHGLPRKTCPWGAMALLISTELMQQLLVLVAVVGAFTVVSTAIYPGPHAARCQ